MRVKLVCNVCRKRIYGETGVVQIDFTSAIRGRSVKWQQLHQRCDPDPGGDQYWISSERISTLGKLLAWDEHLSGKVWLPHTNWAAFMRGLFPREEMN